MEEAGDSQEEEIHLHGGSLSKTEFERLTPSLYWKLANRLHHILLRCHLRCHRWKSATLHWPRITFKGNQWQQPLFCRHPTATPRNGVFPRINFVDLPLFLPSPHSKFDKTPLGPKGPSATLKTSTSSKLGHKSPAIKGFLLDAIASPSTYPCDWVSQ